MKAALSFQERMELFQSWAGTQNTLLSHYHESPQLSRGMSQGQRRRMSIH